MANPRKFSEKIALHNQKQAEETAAFEAILRDVSAATRTPHHKNQHLQLHQNITTQYRAGSLPNVNQMATNQSIDLQTALQHLDDMRAGPMTNRMDGRMHPGRDRGRPLGPHRKAFPRTDCSPYGSAYLSPPPDTSWRRLFRHLNGANLSRTNSDSAIHTSAMGQADAMPGATTPPSHRRIMEMVGQNPLQGGEGMRQTYWDPKKMAAQSQSRPKSCEVPNINIYPSAEQEHSSGIHLPITNSTGSLPDLTVCQFQSPLTTPLDAEDQQNYTQGTPANLSPTSAHHMGMGPPQPPSPQAQSPAQRRRPQHGGPSPLVLSNSPSQQIAIAHSPPVSVPNIDPSKIAMDPRIKQQYLLYIQQQQQRHRGPNSHPNQPHAHPQANHVSSNHSGPNPSQQHLQGQPTRHNVPQVRITSACDQNDSSQPSLSQYRNNVSETNCQSPTSPLSQTSYSPSQSPGLPPTSWNNSPFTDTYQLQQQQTNALQHQFEQFNMSHDNHMTTADSSSLTSNGISSGIYTSAQNSINFSQAAMHGLTGSQEFHQQQPVHYYPQQTDINGVSINSSPTRVVNPAQISQHSHLQQQQHQHLSPQTPTGKIPDIVLTDIGLLENYIDHNGRLVSTSEDADESFAKDLGNAITGFDSEFFPSDEALKVGLDPLDLDGLQMLTDPNMITDPETEQSFKLDRL